MTEAASGSDHGPRCSVERAGSQATLRLRGDLDLDTVWTLGAELSSLIRTGSRHLTIDMSGCDLVSPVCVGVLNRTVSELQNAKGVLALRGLGDAALSRLRFAGLHPAVRTSTRHLDLI
jgi:anti-anti-sigma factor